MEASMLFGIMAVAAAFVSLVAGTYVGIASFIRKRTAFAAQGESTHVSAFVKWRLRNGFAVVQPIAKKLIQNKHVAAIADEAVILCLNQGVSTSRESVISIALVVLAVIGVVAFFATGGFVGTFAVLACLIVLAHVLAGSARDKRREAVREAVPGALESMAACFGSGFTLVQTFTQVAQDTPGYLGKTFERSAHILETGGSAQQALSELRKSEHAVDLAFISIALDVQHQSGGSMKQVLGAASESVKGELALRRSLRIQTAQAKLSARIVVVMPFILVALFSLVSPNFLTPFFSSPLGYALLALAIIMQFFGVILVNRALSVGGVS